MTPERTSDGGCECARLRYRVIGSPIFVNCCHCRQCQKLTGSAFAMNAMIKANRVTVVEGEGLLERDAGGATRCRHCQVLLWAMHPMFGDNILFLRAGTLDEAERLQPDAHFFVRSKHPWVALPPDVPAFETLTEDGDPPLFGPEAEGRIAASRQG